MKYTIGFSPCPNDTFIFDALVNHKMDTGDIEFEPVLEDVQTLNAVSYTHLDVYKRQIQSCLEAQQPWAIQFHHW